METNVRVEIDKKVAWVWLNRPEKLNAMSPALNDEMIEVLDALETDESVAVLVLAGAGGNFSAGMDLKEFFRDVDGATRARKVQVRRAAYTWQYERLRGFGKPTIAMVEGWCLGGAFTPLVSCDIAVAAQDAQFGLSEVNWGILPAGVVSRDLVAVMSTRQARYYALTGRVFNGTKAAEMGLVTLAVPHETLRAEVEAIAAELTGKNPTTLRAIKEALRFCQEMSWETARDYLYAKHDQMLFQDTENGREQALDQFLDKQFQPAHQTYLRKDDAP